MTATLGPNDLLYLPAGWLSLEMVLNKFDVIGYKTSVFAVCHSTLAAIHAMEKTGASKHMISEIERHLWEELKSREAAAAVEAARADEFREGTATVGGPATPTGGRELESDPRLLTGETGEIAALQGQHCDELSDSI